VYRVVAEDAAANLSDPSGDLAVVVEGPVAGEGLVAAYGFEALAGANVADASGHGNLGVISGATPVPAGRIGTALSFDGVDDWVTVPDTPSLDLTSGLTVEAWVRPTRVSGWRTVVAKERAGGIVYSLHASEGSRPVGQVYVDREWNAPGEAALPLDTWSHLAVTFDGVTLRLYVNGVPSGSVSVTGVPVPSAGPLRIGGNGIWGEWFQGLIDEVRVYDRPLSSLEILRDLETPIG
jgi:hypothetical protein